MIKIQVSRADAFVKESETLTSGRVGLQCGFEFSSDWTGLGKTAVFVAGSVVKTAVVSGNNIVEVPWECLENAGINLKVGVYGTNADDDDMIVIPTVWCGIDMILKGTEISGSESAAVTPTLAQQVLANSQSAVSAIITNVTVDDSEAGIVGTPDVTITDTTGVGSRTLKFKFSNLKGATGATGPAGTTTWSGITDKPSTFPPSTHTHAWSAITDKPSTFTPSSHSHVMEDITDLPSIPQSADDITYGESTVADALTSQSEAITTQATKIATIERTDVLQNRDIEMLKAAAQGKLYVETADTTSAYTKAIPSGALPYASLDMVGGKTIVFNQLCYMKPNYTDSGIKVNADATSISVPANSNRYFFFNGTNIGYVTMRKGHKYLIKCKNANYASLYLRVDNVGGGIGMSTQNGSNITEWENDDFIVAPCIRAYNNESSEDNIVPLLVDLTAMYGAGNEPTTVAEFEAMFPNDYYPYNEGELLSAQSDEIDIVGSNLFDKNNIRNDFELDGSGLLVRGTDVYVYFLPISNNDVISFIQKLDTTYMRAAFADEIKNRAQLYMWNASEETGAIPYTANRKLTASNTNHKYFCIAFKRISGTENLEDVINSIQINKGNELNAYAPYKKTTVAIPSEVRALDGYGIGINDTCKNYIDFNRKVYVQMVGSLDLGIKTWSYRADSPYFYTNFNDVKFNGNPKYYEANMICAKYENVKRDDNWADKEMCMDGSGTNYIYLEIKDSAYTDKDVFKTAMNGVMLYYELAEPVETDISAYLTEDFNILKVEGNGSITFHHPNADDGYLIPVTNKITYQTKVV